MSIQNAILGIYSYGFKREQIQRGENILNPQRLPLERFEAYEENAEEKIAQVGRINSWFQLTKPALLFLVALSYDSQDRSSCGFSRLDGLTSFDSIFSKVHSVTFVLFSKHNSDTEAL